MKSAFPSSRHESTPLLETRFSMNLCEGDGRKLQLSLHLASDQFIYWKKKNCNLFNIFDIVFKETAGYVSGVFECTERVLLGGTVLAIQICYPANKER